MSGALDRISESDPARFRPGKEGRIHRTETETRPDAQGQRSPAPSELGYRRLFEAASDGILVLDGETGQVADANPFMTDLLGYSRDEMMGKKLWEIGPFKGADASKIVFADIQHTDRIHYEDLPLEKKDGRRVEVEFISQIYFVGEKRLVQCNVRDITRRKRAEMALVWMAAIVESSDDAIIGKDLNSVISSWNKGAEKIFGYTAGEMIGTSIMQLLPADRQEEEAQILEKITRGESLEHFETLRRTRDGRMIDVSVTASPIRDAAGDVIGVSKVARDITHRKAEEGMRRLTVELEVRVAERTAQLQTANDELEAFSYSVAHDLRAPLRHVAGFVELLQKDAGPTLSASSLRHLVTIAQAAKRMGELIDDLLDFSRVGRAQFRKAEVNLDHLVQQTLSEFHLETNERKIVWEIHPLPALWADGALLRMVLVNLMANAVKFTSLRGEPRIEIGCAADDQDETVIFVRDNGAGFDPKYTHKLFGVFQRLHRQDEFEGTGIGLANVQRIVSRHGGRVWATGVVDGGATFCFAMPKQSKGLHES